jgi:hypothetical protein
MHIYVSEHTGDYAQALGFTRATNGQFHSVNTTVNVPENVFAILKPGC